MDGKTLWDNRLEAIAEFSQLALRKKGYDVQGGIASLPREMTDEEADALQADIRNAFSEAIALEHVRQLERQNELLEKMRLDTGTIATVLCSVEGEGNIRISNVGG